MRNVGAKIDNYIRYFENSIIGIGLIVVSLIIFINVICRYFFGFTIIWVEELARYIVVWITFIGLGACSRYNEHISIDIIINMVPTKVKKWLLYFIQIVIILAAIVMMYIGYFSTQTLFLSGNTSATIDFPIWIIYSSVPLGFALLAYHSIKQFRKLITEGVS